VPEEEVPSPKFHSTPTSLPSGSYDEASRVKRKLVEMLPMEGTTVASMTGSSLVTDILTAAETADRLPSSSWTVRVAL
jgi:hypothetical protein